LKGDKENKEKNKYGGGASEMMVFNYEYFK
jgi:hypothetical protein